MESVGRNCLINPTENKIKSFADKRCLFENNGLLKSVNLKNLCNFLGEFKKVLMIIILELSKEDLQMVEHLKVYIYQYLILELLIVQ